MLAGVCPALSGAFCTSSRTRAVAPRQYVDLLDAMDGYQMQRLYLADTKRPDAALAIRALAAARAARRHELVHVHGEAAAALTLPTLTLRPSVATLHGLHLVRRLRGLAREAANRNLRLVVRAATRTICVSESERHELELTVGAAIESRAVVIRNGVVVPTLLDDAERATMRAELGLTKTKSSVSGWAHSSRTRIR